MMRPRVIFAAVALSSVLFGVGVIASVTFQAESDRLAQDFARERQDTLREAAHAIEEDLEELVEDIHLTSLLVGDREAGPHSAPGLGAILRASRGYRLAVIDRAGAALVRVESWGDTDPVEGLDAPIERIAEEARRRGPGQLATAVFDAPRPGRQLVLFAVGDESPATDALVLVVEGDRLFRKLQIVAAAPSAELLLLNPRGQVASFSSTRAATAWRRAVESPEAAPVLTTMMQRLSSEPTGDVTLPRNEAARLGLADATVVVTWATIDVEDGRAWKLATFNSTAGLRDHERAAGMRAALVAGLLGLCVLAFGIVAVRTARRNAVVEERLKQAARLAHLAEKAQKIVDNVPAAVLTLGDAHVVTAVNATFEQRLGSQWIGRPLHDAMADAVGQDEARQLLDIVMTALRASEHATRRALPTRLFEEVGLCNLHVVPLDPSLPDARALVVFEDIGPLRALEDQLLRSEKLATVGVLAAGIAHEIGTPLGVVRGRAEYLQRKLGEDHPHGRNLTVIVEQIDRISRTIRELLDFSRPKAATLVPVDVVALSRKVADLMQFRVELRKVSLRLDIDPNTPPVAADPDQLEQVLVNLLLNAFDACEGGGTVVLVAGPGGAELPSRVAIAVVDDGCGIPEEHRHRVFDPFFSTKKQGQGTGLGLSIVAKLARAHDADIAIDSELGHGTEVRLTWPVWSAPARRESGVDFRLERANNAIRASRRG